MEETSGSPRVSASRPTTGLRVAIVADDLSGALDSIIPFASRGLAAVVTVGEAGLPDALATEPEVIAINTSSRHLPPDRAADAVARAAASLLPVRPRLVFKKIDSRLKGNTEAETRALLLASARLRAIVAPAVPDLGRVVSGGYLSGRGVEHPISVRDRFGALGVSLGIPDTPDAEALDEVASTCLDEADRSLAVGARGLAAAIAALIGGPPISPASAFLATPPIALVIGSRDPITLNQIACLHQRHPDLSVSEALDGVLDRHDYPIAPIRLFQCTGNEAAENQEIAVRFARNVSGYLVEAGVRTLIASGGDTAAAFMQELGVTLIHPEGEVAPGIPWSRIAIPGSGATTLVTKSGGFGNPEALADLLRTRKAADARS